MNHALIRLLAVALAALPLAAAAQQYTYAPPKLLTKGSPTSPVKGDGAVTVQVMVKKDGSFEVVKVLKTTNPDDNDAALEVAKSSTYQPATTGGKAVDAYYDYIVQFKGNEASAAVGAPNGSPQALIGAGHYAQAKTQLQATLQSNPSDPQANLLLGVTNTYLHDDAGAAAAYDKAGTIPSQYRSIAAQSYQQYASSLLNDQKNSAAIAAAQKAIELAPDQANGYYLRGTAESNSGNYPAAVTDLQKAYSVAQSGKADNNTLAAIDYNLMIAQVDAGDSAAAATTAKDVVRLDSSKGDLVNKAMLGGYMNAATALVKSGKTDDAVALLDGGATAFPALAGQLYNTSGTILTNVKSPDWKHVKAEADKALAVDPNSGTANFLAAVALAHNNDVKGAQAFVSKAKSSSDYSSNAQFAKQVDAFAANLGGH